MNGYGSSDPKLPATLTNQVFQFLTTWSNQVLTKFLTSFPTCIATRQQKIEGNPPNQVIRTLDPRLSIHNLPNYPLLPASTDSRRLEEIRRTIVAINLDPSVRTKFLLPRIPLLTILYLHYRNLPNKSSTSSHPRAKLSTFGSALGKVTTSSMPW